MNCTKCCTVKPNTSDCLTDAIHQRRTYQVNEKEQGQTMIY